MNINIPKCCRSVLDDERGGVAAYVAFLSFLVIGAGALSLDFGRMALLKTQMQNRADAAAMAAAAQLDGRAGAQARAADVATNAMGQLSAIPADDSQLSLSTINFYSDWADPPTAATGDADTRYVEVTLNPRQIDLLFEPVLNSDATADHTELLNARAVAGSSPFICYAPPLMICDPSELNPSDDLSLPGNVGRQLAIKPAPSGGFWAPGNYGLLALPDGSSGASDLETALAAVQPADCYTLDVTTATGVKTNKIKDGINARFDLPGGLPLPAPNVKNYPRDPELEDPEAGFIGSGNWDATQYWLDHHTGSLPPALSGASRYQVYLYELGETFARDGKHTVFPLDGAPPAGFTVVTPPGVDIPEDLAHPDDPEFDGIPSQTVASNGPARRIAEVAILQCVANGVKGKHSYPTNGNYVEMFITEYVPDAPAGVIMGEVIRPLTTTNDPDFHANVELVE